MSYKYYKETNQNYWWIWEFDDNYGCCIYSRNGSSQPLITEGGVCSRQSFILTPNLAASPVWRVSLS